MSDTDKSNQISISDIIQDIDHKPTKDWLEENANKIQETFNGVQKDVNDINGLIESYNTLVVDPDLKQNSLPSFDDKFTSNNIRGVFSNFTDGSGFGITFDDIASQTIDGDGPGGLGKLGATAADLGAGAGVLDDGKGSAKKP